MDFTNFTLFPSHMRRTIAEPDEQRRVGEILEDFGLIGRLPAHKRLRVELENSVPAGTPLWRAHGRWNESYFPNVGAPEGFPRQDDTALSPPGLVKVSVECIDRETPGMGSHFGFEGLYLSVLVSVPERTVWDVRGERAKVTAGR
jgi:hypothetical protein